MKNIMLVFVEKGKTIKIINKKYPMGHQSRQTIRRLKVVYRKDGPIDINEYKFTCRGHWPGVAIVAQAQMV